MMRCLIHYMLTGPALTAQITMIITITIESTTTSTQHSVWFIAMLRKLSTYLWTSQKMLQTVLNTALAF